MSNGMIVCMIRALRRSVSRSPSASFDRIDAPPTTNAVGGKSPIAESNRENVAYDWDYRVEELKGKGLGDRTCVTRLDL